MNKKRAGRLLSLVLGVAMIGSAFPMAAAADDSTHNSHPICGASCADGAHGSNIEWTAWSDSSSLPTTGGSYYLTTNVKLAQQTNINAKIDICLNGHTIAAPDGDYAIAFLLDGDGDLSICDCHGGGMVTSENYRGPVCFSGMSSNSKLNIYGGTFKNLSGYNNALTVEMGTVNLYGGSIEGTGWAVTIGSTGSRFNMYGGTITSSGLYAIALSDTSSSATVNLAGGNIVGSIGQRNSVGESDITISGTDINGWVYARKGTLNISGGSVTSGSQPVGIEAGATLNISGGTITATDLQDQNGYKVGVVSLYGGKLNLSGSPAITGGTDSNPDIALLDGTTLGATAADAPISAADYTGSTLSVGLPGSAASEQYIVGGTTDTSKFTSYNGAFLLVEGDNGLKTPHVHSYDDGVVTKAATCIEEGEKTYTCTTCGATYTEVIPWVDHDFSGEEIIVTPPTCTSAGKAIRHCTMCSESYTEYAIDPLPHQWDAGVVTAEATDTTDGVKTYTCTVCGATYTEAIPATGSTEELAATATPAPTAAPDTNRYFTCQKCGYHNWTGTEGGYRCDHCGNVVTDNLTGYANVKGTPSAAATSASASGTASASTVPQTGDDSTPVLWAVVSVAALLGLGLTAYAKRKEP